MPFVAIHKNNIHYTWLDYGRKENLVLINSLGTNFTIWNEMLPFLTPNFNVLLHDKRGHGFSSLSDTENVSIDDYADDIVAIMDFCKIEKAHIVGLSIGGLIAFSLVHYYPQRVKKLIFSNTGYKIGDKSGWEERIDKIRTNGLRGISEAVMRKWFTKQFLETETAEVQGYIKMFCQTSKNGYIDACRAISNADYEYVAKALNHDSIFIAGEFDNATTSDFVKEMSEKTNKTNCIELPNVGHLPCVESPKGYYELIEKFIL